MSFVARCVRAVSTVSRLRSGVRRRQLLPAVDTHRTSLSWGRRPMSANALSDEEEDLIAQLVQSAPRHTPIEAPPSRRGPLADDTPLVSASSASGSSLTPVSTPADARQSTAWAENSGAGEPTATSPLPAPALTSHVMSPPLRRVTLFPKQWRCPGCHHVNVAHKGGESSNATEGAAKFFCAACSVPFPGVHDWVCPSCHTLNPRAAQTCCGCRREKPIDWTCAACDATTAITQRACRQCHARVQVVTHTPPSPSSSLPEGTVICAHCETLNDAQWDLCTCCLAPLPRFLALSLPGPTSALTAETVAVQVPAPGDAGAADTGPSTHEDDPTADLLAAAVVPVGSWQCLQCNVLQRRNASFCDICLRPREVASGVPYRTAEGSEGDAQPVLDTAPGAAAAAPAVMNAASGAPVGDPLAGDWQCPYCRQFRAVTTLECCAHPRQVPQGYWLCSSCCSTNRLARSTCLGCGAPPEATPWCCNVCATANGEGHFSCVACGAPHPLLWQCAKCQSVHSVSHAACPQCGAPPPPSATSVVCYVCKAPNVSTRRACFRCRSRLTCEEWACDECHYSSNTDARCERCRAPRRYNLAEETWVCELCETAVVSGGDLPVLGQCPFCATPRTPPEAGGVLCYPSRWVCQRCGLYNRTAEAQCRDCGTSRVLPPFRSTVTCTGCFRQTVLDERERCEHCGDSLSDVLSSSPLAVSLETSPLTELGRRAEEELAKL